MKPLSKDAIRATAERALRQAAQHGRTQWLAFRVEVPWLRLRALCEQPATDRFFWERPREGRTIAAFGVAHAIECSGPDRFAESAKQARELFAALHTAGDPAPESAGPLLVGGFGFGNEPNDDGLWSDFPAARMVLPELSISRLGNRAWCTALRAIPVATPLVATPLVATPPEAIDAVCEALCARVQEVLDASGNVQTSPPLAYVDDADAEADAKAEYRVSSDHSQAHYRSRVKAALHEIAAGELEKVVIARSIRVQHETGFDIPGLIQALRDSYPHCTTFAITRPGGTFLGATPEQLVRVEGGRVETAALAGSARRGRSPEEDVRFGRELTLSKKEQAEHAVVVRALCDALAPCCSELDVAEAPRLLKVEGIQHLETPLVGALKGEFSAIELVGRLHPAPSVGGAPRDAALAWLEREEDLDRGWYAAPLGWMDASGGGEFCVALRAALIHDREAVLFAGAGIVEGSDPESELRETRLKLRVLLDPLLEV